MASSFASTSQTAAPNYEQPRIKPDRSWALLGQCIWILLDPDNTRVAISSAEVSWNNIRKKFSVSGGSAAVSAMEKASESYISYSLFTSVLRIINPNDADKYRDSNDCPSSSAEAIRVFTARVVGSVSKHGLWVRDRFGLCLSTLGLWMEMVLIGANLLK